MPNVHEGHRDRLKRKFRDHGLGSFTDVEALELLLFYAIPRRDTNELAHALLAHFGSFRTPPTLPPCPASERRRRGSLRSWRR